MEGLSHIGAEESEFVIHSRANKGAMCEFDENELEHWLTKTCRKQDTRLRDKQGR